MKTIIFTRAAEKQFDALPRSVQEEVSNALDALAVHGVGDVKRLTGRDGFRLRVGRYRVIFNDDRQVVLAIYVGKRETKTYN